MADRESTRKKRDDGMPVGTPFQKGNSGRPKGSRNILGEAFLTAMKDDFVEHGVAAIEVVRAKKPDQYLKVIASLLPKELNLNINDAEAMTDDELIERIRELDATISPFLAGRAGESSEDGAGEIGAPKSPKLH